MEPKGLHYIQKGDFNMEEIKIENENLKEEYEEQNKFCQAKKKVQEGIKMVSSEIKKGVRWCLDNKEDAAVIGTALFAGAKFVRTLKGDKTAKEKEFDDRQLYYYDRRHDIYYYLKRELRTNEKLELERRLSAGENAGDILRGMRVLKY